MISELFKQLGDGGSKFITFLKELIENVFKLVWTPAESGGGGTFTDVGILIIVAMVVGIVFSVIRYVVRLIKLRG
jgi:hypothetical protein